MLEDIVVFKDGLRGERKGTPQEYGMKIVPSDAKHTNILANAYERFLEKRYGHRGWQISMAVREAMINYAQHSNNNDPSKSVVVQAWRDDGRLYFCINGEGDGFDPHKLLTKAEDRNAQGLTPRGRGGIYMTAFSNWMQYDADGRGVLMIFDLEEQEKAA
jgi:anti-sigma regulatory factor (Ser/Thr protein kinase)